MTHNYILCLEDPNLVDIKKKSIYIKILLMKPMKQVHQIYFIIFDFFFTYINNYIVNMKTDLVTLFNNPSSIFKSSHKNLHEIVFRKLNSQST